MPRGADPLRDSQVDNGYRTRARGRRVPLRCRGRLTRPYSNHTLRWPRTTRGPQVTCTATRVRILSRSTLDAAFVLDAYGRPIEFDTDLTRRWSGIVAATPELGHELQDLVAAP